MAQRRNFIDLVGDDDDDDADADVNEAVVDVDADDDRKQQRGRYDTVVKHEIDVDEDDDDEELRECLRLSLQEYQQQKESSVVVGNDSIASSNNNNESNKSNNSVGSIDIRSNNSSRSSESSVGDLLVDDFMVQEGSALLGVIEGEKAHNKRQMVSLTSDISSPTFTPEEESLFEKRCVRYLDDYESGEVERSTTMVFCGS